MQKTESPSIRIPSIYPEESRKLSPIADLHALAKVYVSMDASQSALTALEP